MPVPVQHSVIQRPLTLRELTDRDAGERIEHFEKPCVEHVYLRYYLRLREHGELRRSEIRLTVMREEYVGDEHG